MNCFPLLYKDSLLYDIISRYRRMNGIISTKALVKDLYGKEVTLTSIYFPPHISGIVSNLPYTSKITEDIIIKNHTMYPFYTAFLSPDKSKEIYDAMSVSNGHSFFNKVGICSSQIRMNKYLKFCPICFKEDMKKYGESYWRRLHQIPGVFYCLEHECELLDSDVTPINCRVQYSCAYEETCVDIGENKIINPRFKELNLQLIRQVNYLLRNDVERKELDFIIDFYIDRLRDRGLTASSGAIYMKEFQREFVNFYSHEYLQLLQSDIDIEKEYNWLRVFIRHNGKNRNPLRHLLLLQFLGVEVKHLFQCKQVIGKRKVNHIPIPKLDRDEMREKWIQIIKDNPDATRSELKKIAKGIHTWIYKHDREWYEQVSPAPKKKKEKSNLINWEKRDAECLVLVKKAVEQLLNQEGKPVRICKSTIRRKLGFNTWFNNKKLVKTHEYIEKVKEDIESYRIRKIKWAINEMLEKEMTITTYKIQLYAGFGGINKDEVKNFILEQLGLQY
ncbi:MAG: TnsD family transposase [Anaeromicrobium sp.]|jgi:hypothetical protein|uniref:TnsD family Tn7-like transposition protein n=1 Tax=Anaeromicrobium sp. TaxID=1929132 RepID=UPI0025FE9EB6|nr:TnsD family Tn7-like transposition protein [Anaeromicrobium sp.]MCT4596030.1 TnsD family transposase [Anaeromicrobium sp.]